MTDKKQRCLEGNGMLEIETGSQSIAEIKTLRLQSRLDYGDLKGARQDNVSESHTAYLKEQFVIGCLALVVGLLAGNFALSGWTIPADSFCFLDDYARYACAYSGFGATIFGSMMVNDFILPMSRGLHSQSPTAVLEKVGSEEQIHFVVSKFEEEKDSVSQVSSEQKR